MLQQSIFWLLRNYLKYTRTHPGRGLLTRIVGSLYPESFVCELDPGIKIRIRLNNPDDADYWSGRHEEHDEVRVFARTLTPGMVVLDVGANIGVYSMFAAQAVGAAGRVYAFEPVPYIAERLIDHLSLSDIRNVDFYQLAISDSCGVAKFFVAQNEGQGSLCHRLTDKAIEVPTETLDSWIERIGVPQIDAVKIDVEGAEMHVLRGMRSLLSRSRKPILFVEHNYPALAALGSSAPALFDFIVGQGYAPHLVTKGRLLPVTRVFRRTFWTIYRNYIFLPR